MNEPQVVTVNIATIISFVSLFTGGLGGSVFTQILLLRAQQRRMRRVRISTSKSFLTAAELRGLNLHNCDDPEIIQRHLVRLSVVGINGIEGLNLVMKLPETCTIIKHIVNTEPVAIAVTKSDLQSDAKTLRYAFDRLERDDSVTFEFLLANPNDQPIKCFPRGVDDINYIIEEEKHTEDQSEEVNEYIPTDSIVVTPLYKAVIWVSVAMLIVLISAALVMSNVAKPGPTVIGAFDFVTKAAGLVIGAIVGLLGAKGIDSFAVRPRRRWR